MSFFRDHLVGIATLAVVTSVTASFLYDYLCEYFYRMPSTTYFSPTIAPPSPATVPTAPPPFRQALVPTPAIPTVAPSFDCTKTTWKSERLVCSSQQLAVLDLAMSNAYHDATARSPTRATDLKVAQIHWLRKTREVCNDVPCLVHAYESRILELRNF